MHDVMRTILRPRGCTCDKYRDQWLRPMCPVHGLTGGWPWTAEQVERYRTAWSLDRDDEGDDAAPVAGEEGRTMSDIGIAMRRYAAPAGTDGPNDWTCGECGANATSEDRWPPMTCPSCNWVDGRWTWIKPEGWDPLAPIDVCAPVRDELARVRDVAIRLAVFVLAYDAEEAIMDMRDPDKSMGHHWEVRKAKMDARTAITDEEMRELMTEKIAALLAEPDGGGA